MALERLYSTRELIDLGLGCKATIYNLVNEGVLNPIKVGRFLKFKESEIKAYIKKSQKETRKEIDERVKANKEARRKQPTDTK